MFGLISKKKYTAMVEQYENQLKELNDRLKESKKEGITNYHRKFRDIDLSGFKPVPDFPEVLVNKNLEVYNTRLGRIVVPSITPSGSSTISLSNESCKTSTTPEKLAYCAFHKKSLKNIKGRQIKYRNGVRTIENMYINE